MSTKTEGSIVVEAPISAVYTRWTQFEEFPRFMGGVASVRFLSDTRLEWVAEPEGVRRQWEAKIVDSIPNEKVSWAGVNGVANAGAVIFAETDDGHTQIHLVCEYESEDQLEAADDAQVEVVRNSAQKDLQQFKEVIETEETLSQTAAGRLTLAMGPPVLLHLADN